MQQSENMLKAAHDALWALYGDIIREAVQLQTLKFPTAKRHELFLQEQHVRRLLTDRNERENSDFYSVVQQAQLLFCDFFESIKEDKIESCATSSMNGEETTTARDVLLKDVRTKGNALRALYATRNQIHFRQQSLAEFLIELLDQKEQSQEWQITVDEACNDLEQYFVMIRELDNRTAEMLFSDTDPNLT